MKEARIEYPALTLSDLRAAVEGGAAAFRVHLRLQPAGGPGDKVFPPTYLVEERQARLKYAVEQRRVDGQEVGVVLLDSVASQANRIEDALFEAWQSGRVDFPVVGVDFTGEPELHDVGFVSALHAPHRIADALLRDAWTSDRLPFRDSPDGRAYTMASQRNASAVFRLCPTALILGVWDSTGPKGGNGAKFQRALVSEVTGVGYSAGVKSASRIDPLGIEANVQVYHRADNPSDWTTSVDEAQKDRSGKPVLFNRSGADGKGKPSAINHSNIAPSLDSAAGGVTFDYAQQITVLSLAALRKLHFAEDGQGRPVSREAAVALGVAARTALAALGLVGVALARDRGLDLRSRALLVPEVGQQAFLEWVPSDGSESRRFGLDTKHLLALLRECAQAAADQGLGWSRSPLELRPMPKLAGLIRESRRLAALGQGDADGAR